MPKEADEGGRATSGSARKGKRQHSSPQNPLLDCSLCGKVFSSASSLSKHYLTHSQERKHVCKVCSKAFKRQDHLYVAIGAGTTVYMWGGGAGVPPYSPDVCVPCARCQHHPSHCQLPGTDMAVSQTSRFSEPPNSHQ